MINWNDRSTWPFVPPGYYFLPEVFEAVGRKIFGDEWTGRERASTKVEALPHPGVIYDPAAYVHVAVPRDEVTNGELYFRHEDRAARLLALDKTQLGSLTYSQWGEAYELSLLEVAAAQADALRRIETFKCLQRLAAGEHLIFEMIDHQSGILHPLSANIWKCSVEVALPRFEYAALSCEPTFAMAAPPKSGLRLEAFKRSFTIGLFASARNLIDVLSRIYSQPLPDDGDTVDVTELRTNELLDLVERRAAVANSPQIVGADPSPGASEVRQQTAKAVFADELRAVVRGCVMQRKGADPTKKAIDAAFPGNNIRRTRVRSLHAEIWAEVFGDSPTVGAHSRNSPR